MMKFFVARVEFEPGRGRRQLVRVLVDGDNKLPVAESVDEIRKVFGEDIEIGKVFYDDAVDKCYFANLSAQSLAKLAKKWQFRQMEALRPENCVDYAIIVEAVKRLGYRI